jgi:hypothetical protein
MKFLFAWFCACVVAMPVVATTARADAGIDVSSVTVSSSGSELELKFLDRSPVQHECDYYVSRFEYVAVDPGLLLVELRSPEPCLVDRYGRRAGSLKWTVPSPIRGSGRLTVIVNDRDTGEVKLSGSDVNFISH